jgi:hypothetical protein
MTELTELIGELFGYNQPTVKNLALLLQDIEHDLSDGRLSKSEYDSLMLDVERCKKIIDVSNNIELNTKINQTIHLVMELAKYAKF